MAALASLMVVLSSALDAMDFSIIFCSGIIIETEGDVYVLTRVITFFRGLRILMRPSASFVSLSVNQCP